MTTVKTNMLTLSTNRSQPSLNTDYQNTPSAANLKISPKNIFLHPVWGRWAVKRGELWARSGTVEEQPVLIQPSNGSAGGSRNRWKEGRSVKSQTPGGSFCTRVCSWCREPTATRPAVLPRRLLWLALRLDQHIICLLKGLITSAVLQSLPHSFFNAKKSKVYVSGSVIKYSFGKLMSFSHWEITEICCSGVFLGDIT